MKFVPEVVKKAEFVARGWGSPWLRVDFFIPPSVQSGWKVALNEVEFHSGIRWETSHVLHMREALVWGWDARTNASPATTGQTLLESLGCNFERSTKVSMESIGYETRRRTPAAKLYWAMKVNVVDTLYNSTSWWYEMMKLK